MSYEEQLKKAKKDKTTKVLTPAYKEFEKDGDYVVGRLLNTQEIESKQTSGSYLMYVLETDEGLVKFSLGNATDKEMTGVLAIGGVYVITYKGQEKLPHGHKVNKYVIEELEGGDQDRVGGPDDSPDD